VVFCV